MKEFLNKKEIIETISPVIENTAMRRGVIPIEISLEKENGHWFLRIFIYSFDHSVSHLDCENMSRGLGDLLDDLIPFKYYLEISSPGLNRKFKSEKEYIIFKGHDIIIKFKNPHPILKTKMINCKLVDYNETTGIEIEYENNRYHVSKYEVQSCKLNDKIEINKNKGEKDD